VRLPWVEQRSIDNQEAGRNHRRTDLALAAVIDGHPIGRARVDLSDPVLDVSQAVLDSLTATVEA
jgi:hypothetical protein